MDSIKAQLEDADPFKSWLPFVVAIIVGLVSIIRTIMGGQQCPNTNKIDGQVVVVTGSSGGIGLEICKELSTRGARIILACKESAKANDAIAIIKKLNPAANVEFRCLDLRSFDCVRRFAKSMVSDFESIDVLINNAGLIFHPFAKTVDGFETHLQCNYLGHFLLTGLLLPLLVKATQGRVINVSAHAYSSGKMSVDDPLNTGTWAPMFHQRDAFAHSKLAIILSTRHMAKLLKGSAVSLNVCTPGLVRSTDHMRNSPIMKAICAKVITYPWMWIFMKSPAQGAQTCIHLATDPLLSTTTGEYFNDCEKASLIGIALDEDVGEKLFVASMRAVKLTPETFSSV